MATNFYIADLHLYHDNVLADGHFHERPFKTMEEMCRVIKDNWNVTVTNADTVYILGDVAFKTDPLIVASYLSQLKGNLVLVKGNHDKIKDERLKKQFQEIVDYKYIIDSVDGKSIPVAMSHYPMFEWNGMFRGSVHLYGHVHDNADDVLYQEAIKVSDGYFTQRDGERHNKFRAYNVGCMMEYMNYTPRSLKQLLSIKK